MAIKFLSGLNLSDVTAGSILKLDSNGNIVAATAGTDYVSSNTWSTASNSNIYYNSGGVRIGTYQASVDAAAQLHVFDYQNTDPKLLIEDGNTGDASMQFKISTQQYTMGIDNSDSDKFVLAASSALGTTNAIEVSTTGVTQFGNDIKLSNGWTLSTAATSYAKFGSWVNIEGTGFYTTTSVYMDLDDSSSRFVIRSEGNTEEFIGNTDTDTFSIPNWSLGIGTTSPNAELHIKSTSTSNTPSVVVENDSGNELQIGVVRSLAGTAPDTAFIQYDDDLRFVAGAGTTNEVVRIASTGNVGIGTASPNGKVTVFDDMISSSSTTTDIAISKTSYGSINFQGANQEAGATKTKQQAITWQVNDYGASNTDYGVQAAIAVSNNGSVGTQMGFFTSNTYSGGPSERIRITAAGNVGIGTTSPSAKLHVHHNSEEVLRIDSGTTGAIHFFENTTRRGILGYSNGTSISTAADAGDMVLRAESSNKLHLSNGSTVALTVDTSQNVGIGTTSPGNKLHVNGDVIRVVSSTWAGIESHNTNGSWESYVGTESGGGGNRYNSASSQHTFYNNSNAVARINSSGNLGIGTTSPSYRLDVAGDINTNSALKINGLSANATDIYGLYTYSSSTTRTSTSNANVEWIKIISTTNGNRLKLKLSHSGDNTNCWDEFLIAHSKYGFKHHIQRLPGGRYNGSKVLAVLTTTTTNTTMEVWVKVEAMSSGSGVFSWRSNVPVLTGTEAAATITTTKPTMSSGGTELDTNTTDRDTYTLMTSRGIYSRSDIQAANYLATEDDYGLKLRGRDDVTHKIYYHSNDSANIWEANSEIIFRDYNSGTPLDRFTFEQDGSLQLNAYGAGLLRTNASGAVTVDTSTYVTDVDWNDISSVQDSIDLNSTVQIGQGDTETIVSFQNIGTERGRFEVDDSANSYFVATGFKTSTASTGFLKADGTVDTNTYSTATGVANNADVTPSWVPSTDPGYATTDYVDTEVTGLASESWANTNLVNVSGDTMTGDLVVPNLRSDQETSGTITNNNWYRVLELNGGSGRGKCEFILESNGGSGTPFSLRGAISTTWSAGDQTLTIHHNSLGSIREMRVVRNSAGNRNYLDIKSSGEDFITFTILPHKKVGAEAIDFTDVTTLPSGDTVQDTVAIQGKTIVSQAGNYSAFTVDKDSSVTVKDVIASGNIGINTTSPATKLNIDLGSGGSNGVAGLRIGATSNYASLELGTYGAYGGMVRSYGNDLHYFSGHWRTIGNVASENHSHYWYTSKSGSSDWSTVKMELDHNGNLGIGTTSPNSRLEVSGETKTTSLLISDSASGLLKGHGDPYHGIMFRGSPEAATTYGITAGDQISFYEYGGEFRFYQKNNTGSGVLNEVARIHHTDSFFDSNVGIGTTSPEHKLHVAGRTQMDYLKVGGDTSSSSTYIYDGYLDAGSAYFHQPTALIRTDSSAAGGLDEAPVALAMFNRNGTNNTWVKMSFASREVSGGGNTVSIAGIAAQKTTGTSGSWASGKLYLWTKSGASFVENMVLQPNGNVGVGTSSPGYKLDVAGTVRSGTGYRTSINGDNSGAVVLFGSASDNDSLGVVGAYSSLFNISSGNGDISFQFNSTERMRLNSTGNLGIGTTSPGGRLELNGSGQSWTTAPAIRMWDSYNSKGWLVGNVNNVTAGDFYIRTLPGEDTNPVPANQKEFVIKHETGNVGINNLSPSHKLDVNGVIQGYNSVRVNSAATGSPYFGLYQNGGERAYLQYVDSGDELVMQSDGMVTIRGDVQNDQQSGDPVISFKQSSTELAKIDQEGNVHAAGFKVSGTTGFLKSDGSVDTSTYASSSHNHNSLYVAIAGGYYDSDFTWDGTHDFSNVIKVSGAAATTTNTTALFYGTDGVVEKRSLGTAAFSATGDFAAASHNHSGTYVEYTDVAFTLNGTDITVGDDVTLGSAAFVASSTFATAAQGTTADNALPKAGGTMSGSINLGDTNNAIGQSFVKSGGSLNLIIDSNNNQTVANFIIEKDTQTAGSGTELFRVQENGRVGIATDAPTKTLDVNGSAYFRSTIGVNGEGNGITVDSGYSTNGRVGLMKYQGLEGMLVSGNATKLRLGRRTDAASVATPAPPTIVVDIQVNTDGTVQLPQYGAGILKTNASGVISLDTSTYLTSESDTLDSVLTRGDATYNTIHIRESDRSYTFRTNASWGGWARTPFYFEQADGTGFGGFGAYGGNGTTLSKYYIGGSYNDNIIEFHTDDSVIMSGNLTLPDKILHSGDADTYIKFDTNRVRIVAGNITKFDSDTIYTGTVQSVTGTGTVSGLSLSDDGDPVDPTLTLSGTISISSANITDVAANADATPSWVPATNPNYLTSYTETDTLASVTGRGASTTTSLSIRNLTSRTILPEADRTYDLGGEETRWRVVFCETLDSAGQHESQLQNPEGEKSIGDYATGTVLVWKGGKNIPCTEAADHMRMGIAVNGIDSPLVQGAEPVLVTGSVNEGDYLVTSSVEGHAKAITPQFMRQHMLFDCVIGKALESGEGDSHLIKTWINI